MVQQTETKNQDGGAIVIALERNKKRVAELEKLLGKEQIKRKDTQEKLNLALARVDELKLFKDNLPGEGEVVVQEGALKDIIAAMWTGKYVRLSRKYVAKHVQGLFGLKTAEQAMKLVKQLMNY